VNEIKPGVLDNVVGAIPVVVVDVENAHLDARLLLAKLYSSNHKAVERAVAFAPIETSVVKTTRWATSIDFMLKCVKRCGRYTSAGPVKGCDYLRNGVSEPVWSFQVQDRIGVTFVVDLVEVLTGYGSYLR
jgi:hypothetical protein